MPERRMPQVVRTGAARTTAESQTYSAGSRSAARAASCSRISIAIGWATALTLSEWVSRLCTSERPPVAPITWVTADSRE